MNCHVENEVDHDQEGSKEDLFFIEDYESSESGDESNWGYLKRPKLDKQAAQLGSQSSPPLLLAFSSYGKGCHDTDNISSAEEEQEEFSDQSIEEWMILGGEEQVGDSDIQLNLGYWSSSEDDCKQKDVSHENNESITDSWIVSDKDKYGAGWTLDSCHFMPSRSSFCHICNRMGHVARTCSLYTVKKTCPIGACKHFSHMCIHFPKQISSLHQQKCPTCILCGIQGHIQRDCPVRPCHNCGLPSHGLDLCKVPPVWNQYCQRCGMTGHLSDACPDIWRQYHLTIQLEVPLKPKNVCHHKHERRSAHCYNCAKRSHYGHECTERRMVSGTFPSLPYVCHYDTMEDILQRRTRVQREAMDQEHLREGAGGSGEEKPSTQRRSRTKQDANRQAGRRKTWPEKRREKRHVKRQRREAQAMRGGGFLGRSCCSADDDVCPAEPLRYPLHGHEQSISPSKKKRTDETAGRKSRKNREAERWRKRRRVKRGDLYPNGDVRNENIISPKQRLRHRRR